MTKPQKARKNMDKYNLEERYKDFPSRIEGELYEDDDDFDDFDDDDMR